MLNKLIRETVSAGRLNSPLPTNRLRWVIAIVNRVVNGQPGLPKLKDFPAEMGGSGDVLPE